MTCSKERYSGGFKSIVAVAVMSFTLSACDGVTEGSQSVTKVISETASKPCTRREIAARVAELGAKQAERKSLDERDLPLSWVRNPDARQLQIREDARRRFIEDQLAETNRFVAATGRIQAAVMRGDLKKACSLLDELETPPRPQAPEPVVMDYIVGPKNAPLTVTEYVSFGCPDCIARHYELMQALISRQMFGGRVRLLVREYVQTPPEAYAVVLARCVGLIPGRTA